MVNLVQEGIGLEPEQANEEGELIKTDKLTSCAEDVSIWTVEDGRKLKMKHLVHGDYVFHEECEGTIGTPSAYVNNLRPGIEPVSSESLRYRSTLTNFS